MIWKSWYFEHGYIPDWLYCTAWKTDRYHYIQIINISSKVWSLESSVVLKQWAVFCFLICYITYRNTIQGYPSTEKTTDSYTLCTGYVSPQVPVIHNNRHNNGYDRIKTVPNTALPVTIVLQLYWDLNPIASAFIIICYHQLR